MELAPHFTPPFPVVAPDFGTVPEVFAPDVAVEAGVTVASFFFPFELRRTEAAVPEVFAPDVAVEAGVTVASFFFPFELRRIEAVRAGVLPPFFVAAADLPSSTPLQYSCQSPR